MKVLFVLPSYPFTRSAGFSIELLGVQNKDAKSDIHSLDRKGTCESFSLGTHW